MLSCLRSNRFVLAVVLTLVLVGASEQSAPFAPSAASAQTPPDLSITKSHFGSFFVGSTNAGYTLSVANAFNAGPTTGPITVTDTLPNGVTFKAFTTPFMGWTCEASGQTVTCTSPGPGTFFSAPFSFTVNVAQAAVGQVTNTATVSTAGETNTANNTATDQVTVTAPPPPDLSLSKGRFGSFFVGSTNATYSLTVSNSINSGPTTGSITVTDTLPTGVTFRSFNSSGTGWTCQANGQTVTCTNPGSLGQGGSSSFSFGVNIAQAAVGQATNTATVSTPGETNTDNNAAIDQITVTATPPPDLSLSKGRLGSFFVGSTNATYSFSVSNSSNNGPTTGAITVTDTLPSGLTYKAGSVSGSGWTCQASGQTVTCTNPGPLGQGGFTSFGFGVNIAQAALGPVTNTAAVSTPGETSTDNNGASDATTVAATPPPDLSLSKSHFGSFWVGSTNATYSFSVFNSINNGPTTGAITVTDTLPAGLTLRAGSVSGSGWACEASGQTVTCTNPGPIGQGSSTFFSFGVNVAQAAVGQATNTATVSTPGETNTDNNTATDQVTVTVPPPPDLSISKSHSGSFFVGSTSARYSISVSNHFSASPTTGPITVTDTLPAGLTVRANSVSGTGWGCQLAGQTLTCTNSGPLGVSASTSFSFGVDIAQTAPATVTNTATVSTSGETNTDNNTATDQVTVTAPPPPDLRLSKEIFGSFFVGSPGAGYFLSVRNSSDAGPTTGPVTVTDTLPTGLTFKAVSSNANDWACQASGQVVTCTHAEAIVTGQSSVFHLEVNIGQAAVGSVTNTATVSTPGETNTIDNGGSVQVTVAQGFSLTVTKSGSGTGLVVDPPSIDCGSVCAASYPAGRKVTLIAYAGDGSTFAGWSGACTSPTIVSCEVTMDAAKSVGVTFALVPPAGFDLTVRKAGDGAGTVTSEPAGITCGNDCTERYSTGALVRLTPVASAGSTFVGWSGPCSGTGLCQVTMGADTAVTATFRRENVGVVVRRPLIEHPGVRELEARLSARLGCGPIVRIQFGELGRPFANARVTVAFPGGGPTDQTSGFIYTPPAGTTSVDVTIQRIVQNGGATVSPILFYDGCGEWRTFVGGGPDTFR